MPGIFIIEDDAMLKDELAQLLELNGYETNTCNDFCNAAEGALAASPDCVILDLRLPGADGRAICRDIRKESTIPIIVLTSASDEFTEVMCFSLGANDFVAKPYRPAVLLARINALVQRLGGSGAQATTLGHGGVTLHLDSSEVSYQDQRAQLTRNELRILALLMRNAGTVISRQEIMCDLWESDAFVDDNTLTVNINRLRKTLEGIGVPKEFLQARRALGYVIEA